MGNGWKGGGQFQGSVFIKDERSTSNIQRPTPNKVFCRLIKQGNDNKEHFSTFYETVTVGCSTFDVKSLFNRVPLPLHGRDIVLVPLGKLPVEGLDGLLFGGFRAALRPS